MAPSTAEELPGHSLSILISILNRTVTDSVLERLAAKGFGDIRPSHDAVFEMIDPAGSRVSEMAERARVTKQSMGEQVAYLEHHGYLERRPDPRDGRAKLVVLTARGQAAVSEAIGAVTDLEAQWAEALGERRARAFRRALTDLSVAFGGAHIREPRWRNRARLQAPATKGVHKMPNWPVLKNGDSDSEESNGVYKIQRLLRHHGFDLAPDHKFGPTTEGKVKEFQQSRGLGADGIVGDQTWPKLIVDVQQGMKGEHVFAVQSQWRHLAQDGDFGPQTKTRVTEFQQHNGLTADGIVGMNTWKAMGKGPIID